MTAPAPGDKAAKTRGELLMGPVFPMVVKFGVPTMVSMLTPAIYNLTGAYFVSTLGTTAVAALGIVFSLHMILAAVGIMTGQGCASQTSRLLGAGEYEAAGFIAGTGILLSVLGGVAIGVLICFLGGLMAVDIVPRKATGAALGVVGVASYIAAGLQDVASGWLIDANITVAENGEKIYDFSQAAIFWIAASVISFLLPLLNRKKKQAA